MNEIQINGAKKLIGKKVVFIGDATEPAGIGIIKGVTDDGSFLIAMGNNSYQIPCMSVTCHSTMGFNSWILESAYKEVMIDYGLPPMEEYVKIDHEQRTNKKQEIKEKIQMRKEKQAKEVKDVKEAAKEVKVKEVKAKAKEAKTTFQLVIASRNAETKKAEYGRLDCDSISKVTAYLKTYAEQESTISVQVLIKRK